MQMRDLLFDTPIWLLAILILIGIALLRTGVTWQEKSFKWSGIGVLGLALLLIILSLAVETDKEAVTRETRQLLHAVAQHNGDAMRDVMDPHCMLMYYQRDQIVERVKFWTDRLDLQSMHLDSLEFRLRQPTRIVCIMATTAHTKSGDTGGTIPSTWEMTWVKTSSGWRLLQAKPLKLFNQDASMIEQFLGS